MSRHFAVIMQNEYGERENIMSLIIPTFTFVLLFQLSYEKTVSKGTQSAYKPVTTANAAAANPANVATAHSSSL